MICHSSPFNCHFLHSLASNFFPYLFSKFLQENNQPFAFLYTLVDSVQGSYKDGTEPGTRDCRWYNPMFIYVIRYLLVVVYGCTLGSLAFIFGSMIITMFVILTINLNPFKSHLTYLGTSVVIFTLFIDALYMCAIIATLAEWTGNPTLLPIIYILSSVIGTLPIFYVIHLVLSLLCSLRKN